MIKTFFIYLIICVRQNPYDLELRRTLKNLSQVDDVSLPPCFA